MIERKRSHIEMAVIYFKTLLFVFAAIIFFAGFFAIVSIAAIGKGNQGQLTAAIKTVNTHTHAGYDVNSR